MTSQLQRLDKTTIDSLAEPDRLHVAHVLSVLLQSGCTAYLVVQSHGEHPAVEIIATPNGEGSKEQPIGMASYALQDALTHLGLNGSYNSPVLYDQEWQTGGRVAVDNGKPVNFTIQPRANPFMDRVSSWHELRELNRQNQLPEVGTPIHVVLQPESPV